MVYLVEDLCSQTNLFRLMRNNEVGPPAANKSGRKNMVHQRPRIHRVFLKS